MIEGANPADAAGQTPVCYRHPGRETYVRCGRCERYICPDDMISAAVGFQCPECVREGNKGVREPRTVAGARLGADAGVVTIAIIAINVMLFLAVQGSDTLLGRLVLTPYTFDGDGVAQGGWHRLITAAFLHEQTLHITFNMIVLWLFGRPLEAQLGRVRFGATYLVSALGGSTASYLFMGPGNGSLGASGAVFGLIGALLIVERRLGQSPSGVIVYLGIMLLPGFLVDNIDWRGHIGGLITGAALGALFAYSPKINRATWQIAGIVVITGVLLVAVQLRTQRLEDMVPDQIFGQGAAEVVPNVENLCGELQRCHFGSERTF